MSIKEIIFKAKRKVKYTIVKSLSKILRPMMIGGYKNCDGKVSIHAGISNSTFIDHREKLYIEDWVYIGHHNFIEASNGITIKEGCQITNFVTLTTHSSHNSIRIYSNKYSNIKNKQYYNEGSIYIGQNTFVGPHSVIMPNTNIGKGCIIKAYSFLKGDFPDYSIIEGNPAIVIGTTKDIDNKILTNSPELKQYYYDI